MANTRRNKPKDWASYYEDYYRRQREASGVTEQDQQEYRQYYLSHQDPEQLRKNMDEARQGLISAGDLRNNTRARLSQRNQALINFQTAANQLRNYQDLGGSVEGADSAFWKQLQDQYTQAMEAMDRDVAALRATGVSGFGSLGAQTAQQATTAMRQAAITSGHGYAGKGLVDPQTGMPYQKVLEKATLRNSQQKAEQEATQWGDRRDASGTELEKVRYWQGALRSLSPDLQGEDSNWYYQKAAEETGIESYDGVEDLLSKLALRASQLQAESGFSDAQARRKADNQRTAMAQLYQIDNPDESLNANYYRALMYQAAKDKDVFAFARYNSDYANQLYIDQKQADIQALRSDPTTGPIYQQAMEATRNAGEAERLLQQANSEIYDYSGVGAKTELAIRDLANRYGITVGNGDDALVSFLERIQQEQQHTVDTNIARLQAQGYDPDRLGQYIQQALNEQTMDERNAEARQYAQESPVAASVGSSFQNLLSGGAYLTSIPQTIKNAWYAGTGQYEKYVPLDTNQESFAFTQHVTAVRDEVAKNIEESGGSAWLYGVGMSMLDNVVQMAVGAVTLGASGAAGAAGLGTRAAAQAAVKSASPVVLGTMAMSEASQKLTELTEQGVSSDKAFQLATLSGAIEILTEKIGIDSLVSNLGRKEASQFLQMILQQATAEGMEEGISEIGNLAADYIVRMDDSEIMRMIDAGRRQGLTEQEARREAAKTFGRQVLEAVAAGALSGAGFGSVSAAGAAVESLSPAGTGARIRAQGNEEVLGALATGLGVEYSPDMTDRQLGKTYRAVQKAGVQLQREMVQGMSMDTYAKEKGYDAKTTRALNRSWDAYRSVYGNDMSSREFAATWNSVKAAGEHGMRFADAVSEMGDTGLSTYTLENAWKAGQRLYQQAQKAAAKAPVTPLETAQQEKTSGMKLDSLTTDVGTVSTELVERASETAAQHAKSLLAERINVNELSDQVVEELFSEADDNISTERRGALAMARMITGLSDNIRQVIFVDRASTDAEGHIRLRDNGLWDPNNRTITIDINAGRKNMEQQMTFLTRAMSHELTHSIKTMAPEQYTALERFVMLEMDKTVSEEKLIEAKIQEYADAGIELDKQGAIDELVAEACEQMLERTEVLNRLAQENKPLWEKIRDFFKNAIDKLRKLYKGMDANSAEGKLMKRSIDELQRKWDAAFSAALRADTEQGRKDAAQLRNTRERLEARNEQTRESMESRLEAKQKYQISIHNEMDRAYADALNSGDFKQADRLVAQAAAEAGYWRERWHETKQGNDFHVFDINRADNSTADNQTPYGIFTKAHDKTVGLGGKQMRLFVRADNILLFRDRDTMKQQMPEEFKELLRNLERVDEKYSAEADEMEDRFYDALDDWLEDHPDEENLREIIDPSKPFYESIGFAMPQELVELESRIVTHSDQWHKDEDVEIRKAKEWLTNWLPANGYDAMELEYDNGVGNRVTDALIVLREDQVKLADTITRDDNGNIIPLSERFTAGNKDIRYQISRDTASDMDLLMGASMENLSKAEADHLLRYRDRVNEIRRNQQQIDELRSGEITADVNAKIRSLESANSMLYRKIAASEKTDLMQRIAQREREAGDVELQRMDNRVADLEEEVDELQLRLREATLAGQMAQGRKDAAQLRNTRERLEAQNEQTRERLEARLDAKQKELERARAARARREDTISTLRQGKKRDSEARKRSVLVHKIRNIANDLQQRTLRPTDGKYVPSYLTRAVIDVANLIDDAPREGTKARARYDSMREALRNLRDEYDKLERDSDPDFNSEYDREFSLLIQELSDAIGGKSVAQMSYAEVEDVHDILRTIRYTLIDAVHQIGMLDRITNYETGDAIIREMQEVAPKKRLLGNIGTKAAGLAMSPMRNIRRMTGYREDSVLMELFDDLNTGVRRQNRFVMEANKMFDALREGKNRNTFAAACNDVVDFGLVDELGKPVKMTRMDAMQIILSYERESANKDLVHMESNPVRIADPDLMRKGKVKEAISAGQNVHIGLEQVKLLQQKMTAWDNQFMEKSRELFNSKAKDAINDTSRILKHRNIALGKAYIPFHVDQNFVNREIEGLKIDSTIEGSGSLKSLKKGATQSLIITGLNHVLDDHINFVGKYSGLAIPIRNINKAYNIKRIGSNLSVKSAIDAVWGQEGKTVIESALRDLQRTRERPGDFLSRGLRAVQSGFVKAALLSNISVTIKQAASYSTAGLMLSQRALAPYQGTVAKLFAAPNSKFARNLYAEIDAHTAQHWIRRQGMSTQELGDNAQRKGKIADFERKLPASLNPVKWIQNMDVATAGAIWLACKREINLNGQYQENSSEYWDAVTELYDRVIEQTQPMYDSLHRPEVQKTTNELVRQLVMFRTQPLQNSGILYDAFGELTAAKKSGDKQWQKQASRNARRAAFSQVASLTVFATMTMVAGLLTHRVSRYRDDEEEITPMSVISTILGDMGQNAAGILLPLGGTELYDVIVNKIVGSSRYDTVSVPVADVINEYIDAVSKAIKGFEDQAAADDPDWASAWKNVYEVGKQTAELFGIPASNVEKILTGIYQNAQDIKDGYFPALNNRVDRSNGVNYRRLYQALSEGDEAKFDEVYNELLQNLAEEDDPEKTIAGGLSQEIKQAYLDGDLPEELATEYLVNYTITLTDSVERQHDKGTITDDEYLTMLRNEAYWIMKAWRTHDEDADASTARYADLWAAIDAGGDAAAAREELLAHGVSEKDVDSAASNHVKELYKNGDIDRETAQEYLGEYANKTDGKDLYKWFVEADHWIETGESGYGPYDPLYDAVLNDGDVDDVFDAMLDAGWTDSGIRQELRSRIKEWVTGTASDGYTITTSEARDYLKRYGGVDDEEKLDGYVYWYNFMLQNPDYADEFNKDEVLKYKEYGTGISLDVFRDYLDRIPECDGDPDPNKPGSIITGTKKRDVMAMIDSLPLSNEQKDQLYYANGYAQSTIYEAPWR